MSEKKKKQERKRQRENPPSRFEPLPDYDFAPVLPKNWKGPRTGIVKITMTGKSAALLPDKKP